MCANNRGGEKKVRRLLSGGDPQSQESAGWLGCFRVGYNPGT